MQAAQHAHDTRRGSATSSPRCRHCDVKLDAVRGDHVNRRVCAECRRHPAYREALTAVRTMTGAATAPAPAAPASDEPARSRAFTVSDRSLIRKVHGFMPVQKLLDLLNERLIADLGARVEKYTLNQLQAELAEQAAAEPVSDWPGIRKLINQARKDGLLQTITPQVVSDFAVVFQLTTQQAARLREIIVTSNDEGGAQ